MDIGFLLLDEPIAGLNDPEIAHLTALLLELRQEFGFGILVVEHNMPFVSRLCERLVVLDLGQLIADGLPAEVLSDAPGHLSYLGEAAMLEVTALSVRYGSVEALHDVSIKVEAGQLVAILGANGSGKSTLLRAISGIARAASGRIALGGTAITGLRPEEIVRRGIAHVPEGRGILPDFTVRENLMIGAYVRRGHDVSPEYRKIIVLFTRIEGAD